MTTLTSLYRKHLYVTLADEDRDGIAQAQQRVGAGTLTLNGALVSGGVYTAGDGGTSCRVGHQVSIYSGGNLSGVTFTVVGTDPDGLALSEAITGPNANTVESSNYFYTVTSVSTSATIASDAEIGIVDEVATQRIPIEPRASGWEVGMGVKITGTANVTAQLTMDDIFDSTVTPVYIADTTFASKTATFYSKLGVLVSAVRLVTNSYSSGATVGFHVLQNK